MDALAGKLMLRESAMITSEDKPAFEDIKKHQYFNTNNLWVNLEALKAAMSRCGGTLPLPLIKNKKTVNPRDSASAAVFQLETAMGSAIECFEGAGAVLVPRKRFAPVKTCSDLFSLRSDAYILTSSSTVELAAAVQPLIKLDDKYYKLVDKMEALVDDYPSLLECKVLKVTGPVKFAGGVVVKGEVEIENKGTAPAVLMAGEYANTKVDVTSKVPAGAKA
jgi:UDP-N-acetylglucosamine pyrophosphorylase